MDDKGVTTWVTLEGNDNELDDRHVIKPWPVVDLQSLSEADRKKAKEAFSQLGERWQPDAKWIRVFSLVRGQTLIMPPGTIHAPITLTNCLMRGGMCQDKRFFVSYTLDIQEFTAKNRDRVTNENPSPQTGRVLDYIVKDIRRRPEKILSHLVGDIKYVREGVFCFKIRNKKENSFYNNDLFIFRVFLALFLNVNNSIKGVEGK